MAVDKLVDSTKLDADLTSVANAIRTKGGTSAQMAFPAGFVSAVNAIPTGGSGTKQITITENGTTTEDVSQYANAEITVNVEVGETVMDVKNPLGTKYSEIPDLTVLDRAGQVLYLVVDTSRADDPQYAQVGIRPLQKVTIDRGHISNGAFVVDDTEEITASNYWSKPLDKTHGRFWIYRITSEANITRIDSYNPYAAVSGTAAYQTIVAVYGNAPIATPGFLSAMENMLLIDIKNMEAIPTLSKVYVAKLDNVTSVIPTNLCYTNTRINELDLSSWNINNSTVLSGAFFNCSNLHKVVFGTHDVSQITAIRNMFSAAISINDLDLSGLDLSGVTDTLNAFSTCHNLSNVTGWANIPVSYDMHWSPLTHDSLLVIINALPTVATAQTLTLGSDNLSRLSSEEIAIATAKGWTLA